MIEPTVPAPRRMGRALAPLAVLGLLAGGLALAGPGGSGSADPLPLLANAGGSTRQGEMAAMSMAPAADAAGSMPARWGGLEFEVDGDLPDLGSEALAWDVLTPDLDAAGAARMARALGLDGEPVRRDRSWVLETTDGNLGIWPSEPGWSINFYRSAGAPAGDPADDGERRARRLLEDMGVLDGDWRVDSTEADIGAGVACAEPAILKLAPAGGGDGTPPPDRPVSSSACPPSPPPVRGVMVTFAPVLDGRRADFGAWGVTFGPGNSVQSLWGTWTHFQRRGHYDLRPVSAALDELRSGAAWDARPMPAMASGVADDVAVAPLSKPGGVPVDRTPPPPRVVKITDVELGLVPAPGWDGERNRLYLVPAYRFIGHFEDGSRYEAPVIALAPGAIAPPPPMPKPDPGAVPAPETRPHPAPTPAPTPID